MKPLDAEFRIIRADGEVRWLAAQARVFADETGTARRMVGINVDITERERVEEAVARAREQFERIAATTPDFLFVYDLIDKRFVYANPRVEEQLGHTAARRFKPEVVLCDIGLPGLDGYAVARALRQEPDLK